MGRDSKLGSGNVEPAVLSPYSGVNHAASEMAVLPPDRIPESDSSVIQWADSGDGRYLFAGRTCPTLPAGAYVPIATERGPGLARKELIADHLIDFPGSLAHQIVREIHDFWGRGAIYKRMGFLHRRGYFLYGSQGTGKSAMVQQIAANIIKQGDLAVFCEIPDLMTLVLAQLRKIEPDRPILCIFEDIDAIISRSGESSLLQWLDGAEQINRVINLATSNYPDRLDPRITSRPRRFDRLVQIQELPEFVRRAYITEKLQQASEDGTFDLDELETLVARSRDLPFAALAELMIALKCMEMDLEETLSRLREMIEGRPQVRESRRKMGFLEAAVEETCEMMMPNRRNW